MFQGAPPPYVCSPGNAAEKGAGPYDLHPALSSEYSRLRSLGFMPGERSSWGGVPESRPEPMHSKAAQHATQKVEEGRVGGG